MAALAIYKLDSEEDPVSTLLAGEHVFGRGALLKCDDRRVSRKHGVITVTEEDATITSTHQNPCFYQSASSSTITILPKDSPVNISDGDKFALLADQFWFRIKVEKVQGVGEAKKEVHENDATAMHLPTPQMSTSDGTGMHSDKAQDINNDSDNSMDFLQMAQKRTHEDDAEMPICKKPKPGESIKDEGEGDLLSVLADLKKKEVMSESENEDNKDVQIQPTKPSKQTTPKKGRKVSNKEAEAAASAQSAHDAELESMLFSSEDEGENKVDQIRESTSSNSTQKNIVKPEFKGDNNVDEDNKDGNMSSSKGTKIEAKNKGDDNPTANNNSDKAGTSGTKRQWRDRCWYGLACYRKNSKHTAEYTHPGDSDYESDPNDDRPMCAFGDACYRRNRDHRQAYKHKNQPQKPPRKRAKNNNAGTATKKRTARKQYDESSEDEYDLKDPFMADSGSEYEADSGSDYDDESDSGSGTEEETKRLLKEAKRFTRGKKKDQDDD